MKLQEKLNKFFQGISLKQYFLLLGLSLLLFVLDIITKYIAATHLTYGNNPVTAIPYIFDFVLIFNNGAAWNFLADQKWLLCMISLVMGVALLCVYLFMFKKLPTFLKVSLSMMVAGSFGNLVDRIGYWAQLGIYKHGVIDFLHFSFWSSFPVFNLADSYLVVGIAILIVGYIVLSIKDTKVSKASANDTIINEVSSSDLKNKLAAKENDVTKKNNEKADSSLEGVEKNDSKADSSSK